MDDLAFWGISYHQEPHLPIKVPSSHNGIGYQELLIVGSSNNIQLHMLVLVITYNYIEVGCPSVEYVRELVCTLSLPALVCSDVVIVCDTSKSIFTREPTLGG